MRILYDGMIYSSQVAGGINRYFANVIGRLPPDFTPSLLVGTVREVNYPAHRNLKVYEHGKSPLEPISYRLSLSHIKLKELLLRRNLGWSRFDIFHTTYYSLLTGQSIRSYSF